MPIHREAPPLPGRVRDAIRRQQASSEIVVGWIQLAIVVTFSILYALSPKPYTAEPVFAPEPWVLGAYLLFTLVRVASPTGARCRTGCCTSRWSSTCSCCSR